MGGVKERMRTHNESNRRRTVEYTAWVNMIARCHNRRASSYPRYGGRGIVVCERWRASFLDFLADLGRRPSSEHSLDRIDCDGNYEPGNCRWATETEQQRNRGNNVRLEIGGVVRCLSEWASISGVEPNTLRLRLRSGASPERAVDPTPMFRNPRHGQKVEYLGESRSIGDIAAMTGIPDNSLRRRMKRHGSVEAAISAWEQNTRGKRPQKVHEE